jgi:hypothetical protein
LSKQVVGEAASPRLVCPFTASVRLCEAMALRLAGKDAPLAVLHGGHGHTVEERWSSFFEAAVEGRLLSSGLSDALSDELAACASDAVREALMEKQLFIYASALSYETPQMLRAHGLVARPDLNGVICMVKQPLDPTSGRLAVQFCNETMDAVKLKPANVTSSVLTLSETLEVLDDTAARLGRAGHADEATAMQISLGCLDPQRDGWRERLSTLPPPPPFKTSLFDRLMQAEGVPSEEARGLCKAFVDALDTALCVHMINLGSEALSHGKQSFIGFCEGKQRAVMLLRRCGFGREPMVRYLNHVSLAVDLLLGIGVLPGELLPVTFSNLANSFLEGTCAPMFTLQNKYTKYACALAAFERGVQFGSTTSTTVMGDIKGSDMTSGRVTRMCRQRAGALLIALFELTDSTELPLIQRAVEHLECACQPSNSLPVRGHPRWRSAMRSLRRSLLLTPGRRSLVAQRGAGRRPCRRRARDRAGAGIHGPRRLRVCRAHARTVPSAPGASRWRPAGRPWLRRLGGV